MAASYGKFSPEQEETIYRLKKAGKTGGEIALRCSEGVEGLPPFTISASRANGVARKLADEREELYSSDVASRPAPEGLDLLTKRLLRIAERETRRLERQQEAGRLDAQRLGKLAAAMTKLHGLLERNAEPVPSKSTKKGDAVEPDPDAPPSFADQLIGSGSEPAPAVEAVPEPGAPAADLADVVVGSQGGSFARSDRRADAVPHAPGHQPNALGNTGDGDGQRDAVRDAVPSDA